MRLDRPAAFRIFGSAGDFDNEEADVNDEGGELDSGWSNPNSFQSFENAICPEGDGTELTAEGRNCSSEARSLMTLSSLNVPIGTSEGGDNGAIVGTGCMRCIIINSCCLCSMSVC
jgi:hypothetical protein